MITVDDLISFGHFKREYAENVKSKELVRLYNKDHLKRIIAYRVELGEDANEVRKELLAVNEAERAEIIELVRGSIQIVADSLNRQGITLEQAKDRYKNYEGA